jgi:hypothetical protein
MIVSPNNFLELSKYYSSTRDVFTCTVIFCCLYSEPVPLTEGGASDFLATFYLRQE